MPKFSILSETHLNTCDLRLQKIMNEAIKLYDFSVLEGFRDEQTQNKYFFEGKSKVTFPNSKHNTIPSLAVDIAPYPVRWEDIKRFLELKKIIFEIAEKENIRIRWGGDWDGDGDMNDQKFNDLVHFEIKE